MVTSTLQITLPYPPEQVWQVVTDLTDTAWRSDIARVERTGPGEIGRASCRERVYVLV